MKYEIPSPDAFRNFLLRHQLTGSKAAKMVGLNSRQIRRYTGGDAKVPYTVWYTLNMKLERVEV